MLQKTVLAVDPGSSKCGLALVRRDNEGALHLLWRVVTPLESLVEKMDDAASIEKYNTIIVGSGTRSKEVVHMIREKHPSLGILVVDEKDTTVQARERYWEHNRRRGWRRFVPATALVIKEPVDDFVALILAERVLLG